VKTVDDNDIVQRINRLAEEEHQLEQAEGGENPKGLTDDDRSRREQLEIALDQCWDLLRQRRARRNAGLDPDDVSVRAPGVVEGYQQ
jgi:hypothetical protein